MSDKLSKNERNDALLSAFAIIEKQFGKGSIMKLDNAQYSGGIEVFPSGSLSLDIALGIGGLPKGRIIEIFGPESCGKTTIAIKALAACQKAGGTVAFIDAEHALDPSYVTLLGGDVKEIIISQPNCGEEALQIVDILAKSRSVDMIIVDSVAALTPKNEIDGDMGTYHIGTQARLMSQALRKLTSNVQKTNTVLIFINQIRMKIGVMFGNPETTPGGNALKFYSSIRIDVRKGLAIKGLNEELIGHTVKAKIIKNKMAAPFRIAEFDLLYAGPDGPESEVLNIGLAQGIIKATGSWIKYKGELLGQGKPRAISFLKEHPSIFDSIIADVMATSFPKENQDLEAQEAISEINRDN